MEITLPKDGYAILDRHCTLYWDSPDELVDCTVSVISIQAATIHFESNNLPNEHFYINMSLDNLNITLKAKLAESENFDWKVPKLAHFIYESWWEKRKMKSFLKMAKRKNG